MSWEPNLDENNLTSSCNQNKDNNYLPETPTNGTKFEDTPADPNAFELMGQFEEYDVLLNGGSIFSNHHFKKGSLFYREQLALVRPCLTHHSDGLHVAVRLVLEAIWARHGRFLLFDQRTGAISIAPIATAAVFVRRDAQKHLKKEGTAETLLEPRSATRSKSKRRRVRQSKNSRKPNDKDKKTKPKRAQKPTMKKHSSKKKTRN